jgi:hypothetical protein
VRSEPAAHDAKAHPAADAKNTAEELSKIGRVTAQFEWCTCDESAAPTLTALTRQWDAPPLAALKVPAKKKFHEFAGVSAVASQSVRYVPVPMTGTSDASRDRRQLADRVITAGWHFHSREPSVEITVRYATASALLVQVRTIRAPSPVTERCTSTVGSVAR